jgi:GrpB-like predicted nucleotidyltransferase (UPF0157 family)
LTPETLPLALAAATLELKRELAQRFPAGRIAYSAAKPDFVAAALRRRDRR